MKYEYLFFNLDLDPTTLVFKLSQGTVKCVYVHVPNKVPT